MRKRRIKLEVLVTLIINFLLFVFYSIGTYNYLWGTPSHLLLYNPVKVFREFMYTWDDSYNLGGATVHSHSRLLLSPLFVILRTILDPKSVYLLYKFLITTIAGISMFYFSKLLFREELKELKFLPFISSFIYMFNPVTARWVSSNIDLMTPYALTPAILYFLLKSASGKTLTNVLFATFLFSIALLFNLGSIFVMLVLITLFIVPYSFSLSAENSGKKVVRNLLLIFAMSILLVSWHILPAVYHSLNEAREWTKIGGMERFYSIRANTINTLTLLNAWEMFRSYHGYKIFYFSDIYRDFEVLLLLVPIITLLPLVFLQKIDRRNRRLIIILYAILIIGIIFAQGTNPSSPLSHIYSYLLENVPLFNAIRNSTKFNHLIIFSYSLLFPYSILMLYKIFGSKKNLRLIGKALITLMLAMILLLYPAPFWNGKLFNNYTTGIPPDVLLVSEYINKENGNGSVLILPGPWLSTYKWLHPYTPRPIYLSMIEENHIIFRYGGSFPLNVYARDFLEEFYKNLSSFGESQLLRILRLLRVEYILIDGTVDTDFYKGNTFPSNLSETRRFIENIDNIKFITNFGEIYLYRHDCNTSVLFVPSTYVYTKNITPNVFYWSNYYDPTIEAPIKYDKIADLVMITYDKNNNKITSALRDKTIIYLFEGESGLYRLNAGAVKDLNASKGELVAFGGNGKVWQKVEIIKNGTYRIALKGVGKFKVEIGNNSFILKSNSMNLLYTPPFNLASGKYMLRISVLNVTNLVKNPSFEEYYNGLPVDWTLHNGKFRMDIDSLETYSGNVSLKVSTSATTKSIWSHILSEPVQVKPNKKYLIITHLKYYNARDVHIGVSGYFENKKKWQRLKYLPFLRSGTSDWKEFSTILTIPNNVTMIRIELEAGSVLNQSKGEAITWFDDIQVIPIDEAPKLDVVWLYSSNKTIDQLFEVKQKPAKIITYKKINPTLWKVKLNATKPFMLSFAEAYDPLWEARVYKNGKLVERVKSIPLYSVINGFWINKTGNLQVIIRYKPQDWFELGLKISAITFVACVAYLIYDWRKSKGDKWAKRLERKIKKLLRKSKLRL